MMNAKRKHKTAGNQLNTSPSYPKESVYANAVPIITGTAAPLRVFGRAAKSHALGEFWIILLLAIVFLLFTICKSKHKYVYLQK
jgi:hypothetical protein